MSADAAQQVVWWVPVIGTAIGGTIVGLILAAYKEGSDRRMALRQRERDHHLGRADNLKKLQGLLVGARAAASAARRADARGASAQIVAAEVESALAERGRRLGDYARLTDEALAESERYGLIPEWSLLPDRRLSTYVSYVVDVLGSALDRDSNEWGHAANAHHHVSVILEDLRALATAEEAFARNEFLGRRSRRKFVAPELPFCEEVKPYFEAPVVNARGLDTALLEHRWAEKRRRAEAADKREKEKLVRE